MALEYVVINTLISSDATNDLLLQIHVLGEMTFSKLVNRVYNKRLNLTRFWLCKSCCNKFFNKTVIKGKHYFIVSLFLLEMSNHRTTEFLMVYSILLQSKFLKTASSFILVGGAWITVCPVGRYLCICYRFISIILHVGKVYTVSFVVSFAGGA